MRNGAIGIGISIAVLTGACGPGDRGRDPGGTVDAARGHHDAPTAIDARTVDAGQQVYVYAHTSNQLYRVDPDSYAITLVGAFAWPAGIVTDSMTDLAIDKNGVMIGISYTRVYRVDPANAQCTLLSGSLGGAFNALSFVPAAMLGQTGDDVLVAARNTDGNMFRVDPMTGATTQIGAMGTGFVSSGDLVSVAGGMTLQTVPGAAHDRLVSLAPQTFAATVIGTDTGYNNIWGIAYWKHQVFGFTSQGEFILIDPTTGVATLVASNGVAWWGAAVTTAPVVQ